jgi:glycosyltransferase involved in cell wall biosynthesis
LLEHGETGLLAQPFSTESLAQQIQMLLADRDMGQKITEQAEKRLRQHYSLGRMVMETENMYKKI